MNDSRLPVRSKSIRKTLPSDVIESTESQFSPISGNTPKRPSTTSSDTPFANRSSIVDHTHAVNQSVKIGQMSPSSSNNVSNRTKTNMDDFTLPSDSGSKMSVRRSAGQRAESESFASSRKNPSKQLARVLSSSGNGSAKTEGGSYLETDGQPTSNAQKSSSRAPFASVRRIFRNRSKSQSAPSKSSGISEKNDTIKEVEEESIPQSQSERNDINGGGKTAMTATSPSSGSIALPSTQRRSRDLSGKHNSFFLNFGRVKTPPQKKVDLEGVESEITRISGIGPSNSISEGKAKDAKKVGQTNKNGFDVVKNESKIERISGLPASSEGGPSKVFGASETQARIDRSLTLQSLSGKSPRLANSGLSDSINTPRKSFTDLPQSQSASGRLSRNTETPTPTKLNVSRNKDSSEEERKTSIKTSSPSTSVPKIWQVSRNSRSSLVDDSPVHDHFYSKQRQGSSATSGSASSFRTAPSSFRDGVTPDGRDPIFSIDERETLTTPTRLTYFDSVKSIPRSATSPLAELIDHLENRITSSSTSTPTISQRVLETNHPPQREVIQGYAPIQNGQESSESVRFPSTDTITMTAPIDEDEDEDETSFSQVSVLSNTPFSPKRNTFGGNPFDENGDQRSAQFDTPSKYGHIRQDVSMQDIETSLAAVEAALHDHSVAGSMDPNVLRNHILSPYNAGNISTGSFPMANASGNGMAFDDSSLMDDEARLERITLPPEKHGEIIDAVRQVRKAISSSQLPQIPNEEDSDVSRSPMTETMPHRVDGLYAKQQEGLSVEGLRSSNADSQISPSSLEQPNLHRQRSNNSRESTPMRAARIRQESMQDVEQAYARMIELVRSAAGIDLTPSPMPLNRTFGGSGRRPTQSQPTPTSSTPIVMAKDTYEPHSSASSYFDPSYAAYLPSSYRQQKVRERTQSAAPTPFSYSQAQQYQNASDALNANNNEVSRSSQIPLVPPLPPIVASSSRSARQQLLRESDALSRFLGPLPDLSEETSDSALRSEVGLRGRTSNISMGSHSSRRAMSASPPRNYKKIASDENEVLTGRGFVSSLTGSGGGTGSGTSPSITVKTQGTPRLMDGENQFLRDGLTSHGRSNSQQVQDWQMRSRFSSPSSARLPTEQHSKRTSAASNESTSLANGLRSLNVTKQIEEQSQNPQPRRTRNLNGNLSGGSGSHATHTHTHSHSYSGGGGGYHSPALISTIGGQSVQNPESVSGSNRRSGSIRDWGRLEDMPNSALRPPSGASGSLGAFGKSYQSRAGIESGEISETTRLALLHGRIASPSSSVSALQRRHALERDSLLDMLDRTRTEALDVRSRNEQLQADLHLEVTRVLELQRQVDRQREREEQLNIRIQGLEDELKAEQADRVRIGELLERVQLAVDDAANARNSTRRIQHDGEGDEDDLISSTYDVEDETMEIVEGYEADDLISHRGQDEPRDPSTDEDLKRAFATSPTSSSSLSILQEDLFPIKRRVFDPIRIEDEKLLRQQQEQRGNLSQMIPGSLLHPTDDLQSESDSLHHHQEDYTGDHNVNIEADEEENDPNNTLNVNAMQGSRSPSLRSHPSILGLAVGEQEMRWSLDKESPLELVNDDPSPPSFDKINNIPSSSGDTNSAVHHYNNFEASDGIEDQNKYASVRQREISGMSSENDDRSILLPDGQMPSVFNKRSNDSRASRLPFLSSTVSGISKSTSGASTIMPSISATSSLNSSEGIRSRYPSYAPANTRIRLADRLSVRKTSSNHQDEAAIDEVIQDEQGTNSSKHSSPSNSIQNIRFPSHGSRTTAGDTSYTAQTVSPIGSFISTFPTMSSGVRRNTSNSVRSVSGGSSISRIPTFNGTGSGSIGNRGSPLSSPNKNRQLYAGHTPNAKKINHISANTSNAAMRSSGGYYDTRRPIGYDPVDSSVLDVLSGDDSANVSQS